MKKISKIDTCSQSFNDEQDDDEYDYEEGDVNNEKVIDENITFIPEEDILKEREKMIQEAIEKLYLERDQAILAMIFYEWNIDNLDNWYEDVDTNKSKSGIDLSEETKEKLAQNGVVANGDTCLTCMEEKNDTFFSLTCGHQFCGDCWTEYLKEKLKNPLGCLSVKCQQSGCTCIVPESIYKREIR